MAARFGFFIDPLDSLNRVLSTTCSKKTGLRSLLNGFAIEGMIVPFSGAPPKAPPEQPLAGWERDWIDYGGEG